MLQLNVKPMSGLLPDTLSTVSAPDGSSMTGVVRIVDGIGTVKNRAVPE